MTKRKTNRVREQVMVYLDSRDQTLLDQMTEKTGLPKTELFRRGLRRLAAETLGERRPGSSTRFLVSTAADDPYPPDVAGQADHYLYGGGYQAKAKRTRPKRARLR